MDLFELSAKLLLDKGEFDRDLQSAEQSGSRLSSGLSKIVSTAAKVATALVFKKGVDSLNSLAKAAGEAGDKIDKQSQALGMSRQSYQEWDYILGQSGSSIDSLGTSMKTLTNAITDGSKKSNSALEYLGLSLQDLQDISQEDAFEKVVRAFQEMPDGVDKSSAAIALFGRNGQELLPLLNSSSTTIDELRQKCEELGLVMSDDMIDAAVDYGDALDTLQRTWEALKNYIGSLFLPYLTTAIGEATTALGNIAAGFREDGIAGAAKAALEEIKRLYDKIKTGLQESDSNTLRAVGAAMQAIEDVMSWIVNNWQTVEAAVSAIVAAFAVAKIASFVGSISPLSMIFTAIAAAIALVATNWDKIKGWIGKTWNTFVQFERKRWERITEAFDQLGDWIESTWDAVVSWSENTWNNISSKFAELGNWVATAWSTVIEFAQNGYETVKSKFDDIRAWVKEKFEAVVSALFPGITLPSIADVRKAIQDWWEGVKQGITLSISAIFSGVSPDKNPGNVDPENTVTGLHPTTVATQWTQETKGVTLEGTKDTEAISSAVYRGIIEAFSGIRFEMDGEKIAELISGQIDGRIGDRAIAGGWI